jgi:CheY-like chemotaxis protein
MMSSEDTENVTEVDSEIAPAKSRSCKAVVVIEDDDMIRETLKYALEFEGYTVFTAANGRLGVEMLPNIPKPCLILLDLMMPVMNGWEFVEAIGKNMVLATIPIVVVTAFKEKAQTIQARKVVKKPVDLDYLFQIVKEYCG